MILVRPAPEHLAGYAAALNRGWSPDNVRGRITAEAHLASIDADAAAFLASLSYEDPAGATIEMPDGRRVPRLPGFVRWMWDGDFAGAINLRWLPDGGTLPVLEFGHIGFAVVPWKRRRGYATRALALILPEARARGLDHVELTTEPDNLASRRTIEANGGVQVGRFETVAAQGGRAALRYRIALTGLTGR